MALGVVPLVVDYAGPGELVSADLGYKIPIGPRAAIIKKLRVALKDLAADPGQLAARAQRGQARIADAFTWQAKARQIAEIYEWTLTGGAKPSPF